MSSSLIRKLAQAQERLQAGDAAGAQVLCQEVLARAPRNPDALTLFGVIHLITGHARDAVPPLQQALAVQPRHGAALENLGLAHLMLSEFADAERALSNAAAIPGAPASVFMRLGLALLNQDRHVEAVRELERALDLDPHNADIHLNLGQACAQSGDPTAARRHFETALRLDPAHADAMFNLGVVCLNENELDAARRWFERAMARAPRNADAAVNLGIVLGKEQRFEQAITIFRRALDLDPALILAHVGLASACLALGSSSKQASYLQEAETAAQRAHTLDPDDAETYRLLAEIVALRGARDEVINVLQSGYERTRAGNLLGMLLFNLRYVCDWQNWRAAWQNVPSLLEQNAELGAPFPLMCQPTTPAQQLAVARRWSKAEFAHLVPEPALRSVATRRHQRTRVGYLSSNFGDHAVSDLLAEVLESHDRERFEIFAYACGPDDHSLMRARLVKACEHFVDIANDPDDIAAARIRSDHLDILIDLNGYTRGARTGVLARRPCAIQINWLGYPCTMGADFIDYLIADGFVIPPGQESAYSERVLRMPHCYLPNDRRRTVAAPLARAEYGLPDAGFVFCCFNQVYKITPEIYACWMRLLHKVPHSVLWLPDDNRWATDNLSRAAHAHGIAPERLRFAPRVPDLAQHLARYRAADLALDTFPYTSHTTACDALWSGCLLVGLCGDTFAARVSGSILNACNLPELITYTLEDYERLALRVATDAPFRDALHAKLESSKLTAPLFDSRAFTRDLEDLYSDLAGRR